MSGQIHRQKKNREFITIDTHCLRNKDLKWDAKGLHSYLMQLPDDWKINISDLENRGADGRDATNSPMKALIQAGYVYREQVYKNGKFEGYDYHLFERPEQGFEWLTTNGKSVNGKSVNGKSVNGKSVTSKELKYPTDINKNEGSKAIEKKSPPPKDFDELMQRVNEQAEQLKALKPITKKSCSISCSPSDFCEGGKCDRNGCYESEPLLVQSVDAETLPGAVIRTAEILTGMNTDGETGLVVTHKQQSQTDAYLNRLKITAKASTEKEAREEIIKWCEANPEQVKWSYESARRTLTKSDLTETIIAFSGHYATTSEVGKQLLFFSDPARMFQNGLTKWLQTQNKFDREQSAKAQKAPYQQPEQKYTPPQKPTPPQAYYD